MTGKVQRIIIVEPSPLIRQGLKSIISEHAEFEWVEGFPDLRIMADNKHLADDADLLIVNPVVADFEKRKNIRAAMPYAADLTVIGLIYGYFDTETLKQFDGIIEIEDDTATLVRTLRGAAEKRAETGPATVVDSYDLSEREKEILIAVAKGMTNKEIADSHNISVHTVISHRKNLTRKTGIKTVSGLTVYALLNNLLKEGDIG